MVTFYSVSESDGFGELWHLIFKFLVTKLLLTDLLKLIPQAYFEASCPFLCLVQVLIFKFLQAAFEDSFGFSSKRVS